MSGYLLDTQTIRYWSDGQSGRFPVVQRAADLRRRLAQPGSMLISRTARDDPLGLFETIVDRIRSAKPPLSSGGGSFESASGDHAIVLLGWRSSPFDSEHQAELLD